MQPNPYSRPDYKDDIAYLKSGADILKVFEQHGVSCKRSGASRVEYSARCPWHDDNKPSLSINTEKGVFFCHACGVEGDIIHAIELFEGVDFPRALEILKQITNVIPFEPVKERRQYTEAPQSNIEGELDCVHPYPDEQGQVLYEKLRYKNPKGFKSRMPDGKGGYRWNLGNVRRVLYNLPALVTAGPKIPVYLVEGEKAADRLNKAGLLATCAGGSNAWRKEFAIYLKGREVVILPDEDAGGQKYALQAVADLKGIARSVKLVKLPDLQSGNDVYDFLEAGNSISDLTDLVDRDPYLIEPPKKPQVLTAKELLAKELPPLQYIVPDVMPYGCSLLAAKPKIGKSWLAYNIVLAVAAGGVALSKRVERGEALYLALEDNQSRLKRRLEKLCPDGNVPDGLYLCTEWARVDQGGLKDLEEWLDEHPACKVVVIDTLEKWRRPASGRNVYSEDYQALDELTKLAGRRNIGILVIHHTRKGASEDPLEEISGSFGLVGAADNALVLRRERGMADATMTFAGRDAPDETMALKFDQEYGIWSLLGSAADYAMSKERREIVDLLGAEDYAKGLKPTEIAGKIGKKSEVTVRRLLQEMLADNQVVRGSDGKYSLPTDKVGKQGISMNSMNGMNSLNNMNPMNAGVEPVKTEGGLFSRTNQPEINPPGGGSVQSVHGVHAIPPNSQNSTNSTVSSQFDPVRWYYGLLYDASGPVEVGQLMESIEAEKGLDPDSRRYLLDFANTRLNDFAGVAF